MKDSSIPIIFGITGHRDLIEQDIPNLEKSVASIFKEYQTKYPHTELILISALAEGADILVARVAKELGVTLHVLLPYEKEDYLNSFIDRAKNEKEFNELIEYAKDNVKINASKKEHTETECYELLGMKIADTSNILIALWDKKIISSKGGTSAIVNYQREGFKENRFDAMAGNAIFIIKTPRKSNPINSDFKVEKEYLGHNFNKKDFEDMLINIDNLNKEINKKLQPNTNKLEAFMNFFDKRANSKQMRFKLYSKAILFLTFIAFISLELMDYYSKEVLALFYGGGLLLAFLIYFVFMKSGKLQNNFVYSRAFGEALRVQNAFNCANINENVSNYHLKDEHHKFTWIRVAVKNITYLDNKPLKNEPTPKAWIDGQIEYFNKKGIPTREKKLEFWEYTEKLFYTIGFISLILMFIGLALSYYNLLDNINPFMKNFLESIKLIKIEIDDITKIPHIKANWQLFITISGIFLLAAAFIGEKYKKIEGFKDDLYNFKKMKSIFEDANKRLKEFKPNSKEYKEIIKDLGIKALQENSKWVVLHDKMRAKPSLE